MTPVVENKLVENLTAGLPRSVRQLGGLQESDAELLRLPGTGDLLAITTDSIAEEIEIGLYSDPYLIGWMAVIVNASDLAAVGASPLGILLSETLPFDLSDQDRSLLQSGIRDACAACELPVLGGDTNTARHFQIGATAIGLVQVGRPMMRIGCRPGDILFATGPLGLGTCFALAQLGAGFVSPMQEIIYRPTPRLREGRLLRPIASACMDTSDGALATVDQLMRLNGVGFVLNPPESLHPEAARLADQLGLPEWMMLAGLHGEFELLFTMSSETVDGLLRGAASEGWEPVRLGRVVADVGVWLEESYGRSALDTGRIRNLFTEPLDDLQTVIRRLKTTVESCTY